MKLHKIHDSSNRAVIKLLEENLAEIIDEQYIQNYHPKYKDQPGNLFYILNEPNGRYQRGCYYVIESDNEYVCSAGWNEYELNSNIALALTRAYVSPKYRTKYYLGNYILPEIIASTRTYNHLYITSNSYNSAIYQWFVRANQNKSTAMFNNWPEIYRKFKPIGILSIYHTQQFVVEYNPTAK
jgi:hypothetical protein